MPNIKWKSKAVIETEQQKQAQKKAAKERFKGKDFKILTNKEKDELLERMARDLGYIE